MKTRGPGARWRDYSEALRAMQPGDVLAWDVPCVRYAQEIAEREGGRRGWLWATRSVPPSGGSGGMPGRVHVVRFT